MIPRGAFVYFPRSTDGRFEATWQFFSNFPQDRRFRVRLGNILSMSNVQENGVSQGSVLSVTLFAITINSVVSAIGLQGSTSLYVDDVAISEAYGHYRTQTPTHDQPPHTLGVAKRLFFLCRKNPSASTFCACWQSMHPLCCI
jgi:hypothetical protein